MKIMTPGPTQVRENVRLARSRVTTNPDLDLAFYDFYKDTCELLSKLLFTQNRSYILSGEGILGLEAACASLTEPNSRVLVLDNGIFGAGFADFVELYGGRAVRYRQDYRRALELAPLAEFLRQDHDFTYATLVHVDTPSAMKNDLEVLCPLLKSYGILTVVDSVAGMFGEELNVDQAQIDILCGGSQKALSAPPGLTMLTVSPAAVAAMRQRKTPVASFYANILNYVDYYENKWFPYTMPVSDIEGLRAALENVSAEPQIVARHARLAKALRSALTAAGLKLFGENGYSNNVTAFELPLGISAAALLNELKEKYSLLLAGSLGELEGKLIRIGHMGENANFADLALTCEALNASLPDLGFELQADIKQVFANGL